MSTASASHDCSILWPDNESSTQAKSSRSAAGQHDRLGFPSPGSRADVLADKYSDAASRAVPSIEIDESTVSEEFELSAKDKETGYCDVLWTFFYCATALRHRLKIVNKKFSLVLARELPPYYKPKAKALAREFQSWVDLGTLHRMFYLLVRKTRMDKDSKIYQVVKKCKEEAAVYGKMVLEDYNDGGRGW